MMESTSSAISKDSLKPTKISSLLRVQMPSVVFPKSRFSLVPFTPLLISSANSTRLQLDEEDEDEFNFRKKYHRRLYFHNLILTMCETIRANNDSYKSILYVDTEEISARDFRSLKKIAKLIPVVYHLGKGSVYDFIEEYSSCPGKSEEMVIKWNAKLDRKSAERFTFANLHSFCRKYELNYLTKTYFEDLKTKLLLLS